MPAMWMVRGDAGRLYEEFRDSSAVALGMDAWASQARKGMSRNQLKELYRSAEPTAGEGKIATGASQIWRFINEIAIDDFVVTYAPANRTYLLGVVAGDAVPRAPDSAQEMALTRVVDWKHEIPRDSLSQPTKNSLGSTLTIFQVPARAAAELLQLANGRPASDALVDLDDVEIADPLADVESLALERIKDLVSSLDWSDMQDLVAGILRAMGYKTQVSPAGPDRGKDIIASPDGFGFENPRIVVEVKHRAGQMGAQAIRSFLGGRHRDDRGLYVSTGGFSKDAFYEADRAQVPLTLWTLDNLVRALVEHYDSTDTETKRIVPLRRMYWPA